MEGGLFVYITMSNISGDDFNFSKEYYTVLNGIVYSLGKNGKYVTGNTPFNIREECKRIGKYNPDKTYEISHKEYNYKDLKKIIKF
jgi:uncharacterized protein (UPF0333 family)